MRRLSVSSGGKHDGQNPGSDATPDEMHGARSRIEAEVLA